MTLNEREAFWTEQLPIFKEKYWIPDHLEVLEFDMKGGCFDIAEGVKTDLSEEDLYDIYHRVNSGWAMWKKAVSFMKEKAKAQAVPEGFKLVPNELSEVIAEKLATERVQKPRPENDPVWVEIAERAYKSNLLAKKWELVREYKILTEASESGAEG